jgi:DNA-binding GntR family transcriptional regulator
MAMKPEKTTAATLVYAQLRRDILNGQLAPGQKLQIEAVSARYGAGGNPVREALSRLSSEGLVDRKEQRGFAVAPIGIENWRALVKTRCWAEGKALEESLLAGEQAWEERVVLAFHRLSRSNWTLSTEAFVVNPEWQKLHRAYHLALISGCGSPFLIQFCENLMDQAQRYWFISASAAFLARDSEAEHRAILDATLAGDAALATRRLTEHYTLTLDIIEQEVASRKLDQVV